MIGRHTRKSNVYRAKAAARPFAKGPDDRDAAVTRRNRDARRRLTKDGFTRISRQAD